MMEMSRNYAAGLQAVEFSEKQYSHNQFNDHQDHQLIAHRVAESSNGDPMRTHLYNKKTTTAATLKTTNTMGGISGFDVNAAAAAAGGTSTQRIKSKSMMMVATETSLQGIVDGDVQHDSQRARVCSFSCITSGGSNSGFGSRMSNTGINGYAGGVSLVELSQPTSLIAGDIIIDEAFIVDETRNEVCLHRKRSEFLQCNSYRSIMVPASSSEDEATNDCTRVRIVEIPILKSSCEHEFSDVIHRLRVRAGQNNAYARTIADKLSEYAGFISMRRQYEQQQLQQQQQQQQQQKQPSIEMEITGRLREAVNAVLLKYECKYFSYSVERKPEKVAQHVNSIGDEGTTVGEHMVIGHSEAFLHLINLDKMSLANQMLRMKNFCVFNSVLSREGYMNYINAKIAVEQQRHGQFRWPFVFCFAFNQHTGSPVVLKQDSLNSTAPTSDEGKVDGQGVKQRAVTSTSSNAQARMYENVEIKTMDGHQLNTRLIVIEEETEEFFVSVFQYYVDEHAIQAVLATRLAGSSSGGGAVPLLPSSAIDGMNQTG